MNQTELVAKYKEIIDQKKIGYFQPYNHFKTSRAFYSQLQDGVADEYNFFTETMVIYQETTKPDREPDFTSDSGSRYWYSKEGVIRGSDHWGNGVARCDWAFRQKNGRTIYGYDYDCPIHLKQARYGFARWEDFLFKAKLIEIDGEELVTTFRNTKGMDLIEKDGRLYRRVVTESYVEDGE